MIWSLHGQSERTISINEYALEIISLRLPSCDEILMFTFMGGLSQIDLIFEKQIVSDVSPSLLNRNESRLAYSCNENFFELIFSNEGLIKNSTASIFNTTKWRLNLAAMHTFLMNFHSTNFTHNKSLFIVFNCGLKKSIYWTVWR